MLITNRKASEKLAIDFEKWKRWSRTFLPPDPRAGRQQGVTREYTLEEAFTVYLGGYLVGTVKLSTAESRRIITYIVPSVLEEMEIFPMSKFREMLQGFPVNWDLEILRWKKTFVYQAKGTAWSQSYDLDAPSMDSPNKLVGTLMAKPGRAAWFKQLFCQVTYGPPEAEYDRNRLVGFLPLTLLASRFLAYLK